MTDAQKTWNALKHPATRGCFNCAKTKAVMEGKIICVKGNDIMDIFEMTIAEDCVTHGKYPGWEWDQKTK